LKMKWCLGCSAIADTLYSPSTGWIAGFSGCPNQPSPTSSAGIAI
jgi:hypothetical protein